MLPQGESHVELMLPLLVTASGAVAFSRPCCCDFSRGSRAAGPDLLRWRTRTIGDSMEIRSKFLKRRYTEDEEAS